MAPTGPRMLGSKGGALFKEIMELKEEAEKLMRQEKYKSGKGPVVAAITKKQLKKMTKIEGLKKNAGKDGIMSEIGSDSDVDSEESRRIEYLSKVNEELTKEAEEKEIRLSQMNNEMNGTPCDRQNASVNLDGDSAGKEELVQNKMAENEIEIGKKTVEGIGNERNVEKHGIVNDVQMGDDGSDARGIGEGEGKQNDVSGSGYGAAEQGSRFKMCYANMLKGRNDEEVMKMVYREHEYGEDGDVVIYVPVDTLNEGCKIYSLNLYGYFVGLNMPFNMVVYHLRRMWRKYQVQDISLNAGGVFLFKFRSEEGMQYVLENGP